MHWPWQQHACRNWSAQILATRIFACNHIKASFPDVSCPCSSCPIAFRSLRDRSRLGVEGTPPTGTAHGLGPSPAMPGTASANTSTSTYPKTPGGTASDADAMNGSASPLRVSFPGASALGGSGGGGEAGSYGGAHGPGGGAGNNGVLPDWLKVLMSKEPCHIKHAFDDESPSMPFAKAKFQVSSSLACSQGSLICCEFAWGNCWATPSVPFTSMLVGLLIIDYLL